MPKSPSLSLPLGERTLATALKEAGYETAITGKWHLGDEAAYLPDRRGFEEGFIHGAVAGVDAPWFSNRLARNHLSIREWHVADRKRSTG